MKLDLTRPQKIRVIGGPPIKTPPDADFQQVPFTLLGLSEAEGIEHADLIVFWPSPDLFIRENIAKELVMLVKMIVNGNVHALFGFRVKRSFITGVDTEKEVARYKDHIVLGPSFDAKLDKDRPPQGYSFAISLTPPVGRPNALASIKFLLENHIIFTWLHDADIKKGNWSGYGEYCGACDPAFATYAESSGLAAPEKFIENIVTAIMGRTYPAIYRGATVAVIVPSGFTSSDGSWSIPSQFRHAYSWLSPLINCKTPPESVERVSKIKNTTSEGAAFIRHLKNWRKLECDPDVLFAVARRNSDGSTDMVGEGIFRPTELKSAAAHQFPYVNGSETDPGTSPTHFAMSSEAAPAFRIEPLSSTKEGDALGLVFKYGAGGLVLMTEPPGIEPLLGVKMEHPAFKKIEPTNERVQLRGSTFRFIVRVTLATGENIDVPMVPLTFKRFLAFCVAGLLAAKNGSDGAIDVTTMKIGRHDLSATVPPIYKDHPHKPRQNVNRAFEKAFMGKADPNIIDDSVGGSMYPLKPSLRKIADVATLQKSIKASKKRDKHDKDIIKILAILN